MTLVKSEEMLDESYNEFGSQSVNLVELKLGQPYKYRNLKLIESNTSSNFKKQKYTFEIIRLVNVFWVNTILTSTI